MEITEQTFWPTQYYITLEHKWERLTITSVGEDVGRPEDSYATVQTQNGITSLENSSAVLKNEMNS